MECVIGSNVQRSTSHEEASALSRVGCAQHAHMHEPFSQMHMCILFNVARMLSQYYTIGCRKEQRSSSGSTTCCQTAMRLSRPLPDALCSSRNPLLLMCLKMLQQLLGQAATGIEPWHDITSIAWMPMFASGATWAPPDACCASACIEVFVTITYELQCPLTCS